MFNAYRELFTAPGTLLFTYAGLLARLPLPMMGIGIITMLVQLNYSYSLAGAVSATYVFTYALISPQISRLIDKYGQSNVLPVSTIICVLGALLMLAWTYWILAQWFLFAGAVLTGFMPSMSAMIRARWTAIFRGKSTLQTAYSLETVLDEVTFIAGPLLSVGLCVVLFPQSGPLAAIVLLSIGVIFLVAQKKTEPPVEAADKYKEKTGTIIKIGQVQRLALLMIAMGVIVGTVDIVSVAFAQQIGQPAAASLVLSAYAIGSCLAGLLFGVIELKISLQRMWLLAGLATTITTLPLLFVNNIFTLASAVFIAGLFFAPTMIIAMSLVERSVPERSLTEGMTWLLSGLNVGVALGATLSGQVVDINGARSGFNVSLAAGGIVLLVVIWTYYLMRDNNEQSLKSSKYKGVK